MTTLEKPTDEEIRHQEELVARIKDLAESDPIAEFALNVFGYAMLLQGQLNALQTLVMKQNDVLKLLVDMTDADTVAMPECPADLPGYG
jgi:hypothetical protein